MTDLRAVQERGEKAARLINDPILAEAFAEVRRAIHESWESAPVRDHEGAHELKLMLRLVSDVQAVIERAIADGKLAAAELEQLNRRKEVSLAEVRALRR